MARGKKAAASNGNGFSTNGGANLGFEATLWKAADKLRSNMDAGEYKHVVLGLIFLKYISDAFETRREHLLSMEAEGADPEDRDEYVSEGFFWVPPEARWSFLLSKAKLPEIGRVLDDALLAIEKENPTLKGVLPKEYARPTLDKTKLGELVDLIGTIGFKEEGDRSRDILGRVFEYFLGQFASSEGKKGGQFYTPRCVVRLLVEMMEPYRGRVYDPCCGSAGMFVQSDEFIKAHGGNRNDLSVFGQESNPTTWRLARMNLAIRGIEGNLGPQNGDTFLNDLHKDLKADFIIANPPFNLKDWGGENLRSDVRWKYGIPPAGNANFGWIQHMIFHLAPTGMAGFVMANGSLSSNQSGEGEIRKAILEDDLVDCIVAMPGQLFYSTQIPACLWFLARDKSGKPTGGGKSLRKRSGETLFVDARKLGSMVDRTHREFVAEDIKKIADTYHSWRGEEGFPAYEDIPGFCKGATLEEIRGYGYALTPGRYVGAEELDEDDEPFEEKMRRLVATLKEQMEEGKRLDAAIEANLEVLGYGR